MLGLLHFGPYSWRVHMLATNHLASEYRLDLQLSLVAYVSMSLVRWEAFGPKWIRSLVVWPGLFFLGGMFWLRPWRLSSGAGIDYLLLSIIFSVVVFGQLYGPWRVVRGIDEVPDPSHSPALDMAERIRAMREAR